MPAFDYKDSCRAVAIDNVHLLGGAPKVVDGVCLRVGARVLVTGQANPIQNGIYVVTYLGDGSNGTWVRSPDADWTNEVTPGFITFIEAGEQYAHSGWQHTSPGSIMGQDSIRIQRFTGLNTRVIAGRGLTKCFAYEKDRLDVNGTENRILALSDRIDIAPQFVPYIHGYGLLADRPDSCCNPPVDIGVLYYATDTQALYRWNGAGWDQLAIGDPPNTVRGSFFVDNIGDNNPTPIFRIITAASQGGSYSARVHGVAMHQAPTSQANQASMGVEGIFTRVVQKIAPFGGVSSPFAATTTTANAANNGSSRDVVSVVLSTNAISDQEVEVRATIDISGSDQNNARIAGLVEVVHTFATAPTIVV